MKSKLFTLKGWAAGCFHCDSSEPAAETRDLVKGSLGVGFSKTSFLAFQVLGATPREGYIALADLGNG